MEINADLHAHSGYAGGVGKISLANVDEMMSLKGIDLVGTGDCLHPGWLSYLRGSVHGEGIYAFEERETKFILQTEVILTAEVEGGRKSVHTVFLFPSFDAVEECRGLLKKWGVKNTIGRPFVVCEKSEDVSRKLYEVREIDDEIEVIPAHILTPDGIYGSNRPITYLRDFFGEFSSEISAVETGLSADPWLLGLIPELREKTWISSSDAHSHFLHRMGREFSTFEVGELTFSSLVEALRENRVVRTAEFHPAEGRYFFTGHRGKRRGHKGVDCSFSPDRVPADHVCPVCGKTLTIGVFERALTLRREQGGDERGIREIVREMKRERNFVTMIPLAEVIGRALGIGSAGSKKVLREYKKVVERVGSECALWFMGEDALEERLKGIDERVYSAILAVERGEFGFFPPGFDGEYGKLVIGRKMDFLNTQYVSEEISKLGG